MMSSRSTRSRSRAREVAADIPAAAAAAAIPTSTSIEQENGSTLTQRRKQLPFETVVEEEKKQPASVAKVSAGSPTKPAVQVAYSSTTSAFAPSPVGATPLTPFDQYQYDPNRTSYFDGDAHSNDKYYWCSGTPDLKKVSIYLDTLTNSDAALRGATTQLSENVQSLNATVQQLLDMNGRLKRQLKEQKLSSNRRWIWAVLLLFAYTMGQGVVRSAIDTVGWALNSPHEFFPALLEFVQVMSTWCFVLAFPLGVFLFIHKILNGYGAGSLSLLRTISYLVLGIMMQVPFLYFIMQIGLVFFADLRTAPMFTNNILNHSFSIMIWLGMMLLDYILIVLHQYVQ